MYLLQHRAYAKHCSNSSYRIAWAEMVRTAPQEFVRVKPRKLQVFTPAARFFPPYMHDLSFLGILVWGPLVPTAASFYPPIILEVPSVTSLAEQLHQSIGSMLIYRGVHRVSTRVYT